ncbi:hypothetical protein Tco_0955388 [Tanacetum coccineum]|uniref:Uncharacterized protein n=1 Tax=Tanacetum coccineum TaxID=301880 RepID=A0ABQ5E775_9ASTR
MLAIQAEKDKGSGHPSEPQPPPSTTQPTNEEPILNVTSEPIPNVPDEAVYEEWDDKVERATTTATSLDAEHISGNINRTQSMAMPNVPLPQGIGAGGSPRCQKAMGGSIAQTSQEDQPEDQLRVFSAAKVLADVAKENVYTYTRRRRAVSTSSGGISTAEESVSTGGTSMPVIDDSDSKGGSDEDVDEKEEAEAFNLMARNFCKFFHNGNLFGSSNRFGNGANRFGKGRINRFGNKGGEGEQGLVGEAWSDSEDGNEPQNDAICLMAIGS